MDVVLASLNTVGLIFGGCCSNVFALEAIINIEPDSGLLITFFQFLFTALAAYPSQLSLSSPYFLSPPNVPMKKWVAIAAMFFSVNMLNNWAFAFKISVPVHIILRSFGSVTTMLAGWIRGKRYSWLQVGSVAMLTLGVLVSATADAQGKNTGNPSNGGLGKSLSTKPQTSTSDFTSGLAILLLAQCLSAYMGIYVQDTYAAHGASWKENLFYSHFLSLPFFLPLASTLRRQYARLAQTPPMARFAAGSSIFATPPVAKQQQLLLGAVPAGIGALVANALTQLACISGVNLLSAQASAVTVTIVLNIRKLVSFVISTVYYGHSLSGMMVLGAALVFGSGALYGWETSWRIPQQQQRQRQQQQKLKAEAEAGPEKEGKKMR
ncbi:hypothetical protein MBLNU459_g6755t1 [Dothideomycetes sp. NU459]